MATNDRQLLGIVGENIACAELQQRGYEILARRYRTRHGEIDIIAREGETTVFIEVKTAASRLTARERSVKAAVEGRQVAWLEVRAAPIGQTRGLATD